LHGHNTYLGTPATLRAALAALDLERIKFKLTHAESGKGWDPARADEVEERYKRFLFLTVTVSEPIVPSTEVDEFWHAHILDTQKYQDDCQKTFGFFLHHFPYFGIRGEEDASNLKAAFERTKELYAERYGEPYLGKGNGCASGCLDAEDAKAAAECSDVSCQACGWSDAIPELSVPVAA
jgi:hypothetical protein